MMTKPALSVLIKPASGACNMRCRYCFYNDEMANRETAVMGMMTPETLEVVVRRMLEATGRECTFMFQGGEPTLAGLDFYRTLEALVARYNTRGVRVRYAIQTNGFAVDEEWARLFARMHFLVGLSLDGGRELHDANRRTPSGRGTFDAVMRTAQLLRRHGVEFNILTVVTGATARGALRLHNFFRAQGFGYQQYIPCLDPLCEAGNECAAPSLTAEQYGTFLCRSFDAWYAELVRGNYIYNRTFENWMAVMLGMRPENCGMAGICSPQYVIEADGGVYPCDFYVLDEYRLGSILTDSLEALDARRDELGFIERSTVLHPDCRACRYLPLCRGGCYRERVEVAPGEPPKNRFCAAYLRFFAYAEPRLRDAAARMR